LTARPSPPSAAAPACAGSAFASAGGTVVHYSLAGGAGAPPVVFLHSLGTDLRIWDGVVQALGTDRAIVRYDLRGHGLSDCPPGPYRLADFVADLRGLLERLAVARAVLVGISIGGLIAMEYALHHPDGVESLVLADTAGRIGTAEHWHARIEAVRRAGLERLVPTALETWFTESFRERESARARGYGNLLARTPAEGYVASCAVLAESDLDERATAIRVPALVMTGEEDRATPPAEGRALAAAIPGARFESIPGAAHLPCIEQPERMASAIRRFLEEQRHG
jgi:3-oxoadipate enol-lactonase